MKAFESLHERTNFLTKALLRSDIEIIGISEKPAENLHHLFLTLAVVPGIKLPRNNPNDVLVPSGKILSTQHSWSILQHYKTEMLYNKRP